VAGKVDRCVAICGSGVGASVGANKANGVRACLIHDHFSAKEGVEDDHTNILCMADQPLARKSLGISSKLISPTEYSSVRDIFVAWARSPRLHQKGELHEQRQNGSARRQHNPHALD
jgi:ribose 5-phosphate isomerase RpiB